MLGSQHSKAKHSKARAPTTNVSIEEATLAAVLAVIGVLSTSVPVLRLDRRVCVQSVSGICLGMSMTLCVCTGRCTYMRVYLPIGIGVNYIKM